MAERHKATQCARLPFRESDRSFRAPEAAVTGALFLTFELEETMSILGEVVTNAKAVVADKAPLASDLLPHLMDYLRKPEIGGIQGLEQKLEKAGLGNRIQSWISGDNPLPITGPELTRALGSADISLLASKAGITNDQASRQLAELIPNAVKSLASGVSMPHLGGISDVAHSFEEKVVR